ncbi:MAG TPA: hypothetical protein VIX12_07140, partial [Candidatus Binataceae bacterium]
MPRKSKHVKPRPLYVPVVPRGASWLESDSYDRHAWNDIVANAPSIKDLIDSGERLVPHFSALVQDLFLALFKYNLVWNEPDEVRRAAALNRTILKDLLPAPVFEALKTRTLLEEDKSAIGAIVLAEQTLEMIRSERLLNRREMLDLFDLAHQEQDLEERAATLKNAQEMLEPKEGEPSSDENTQKKIAELAEAAERAAKVSEARLNQKVRQFESDLKHGDRSELKRIQLKTAELASEIDRAAADSHEFSR